MHALSHPHTNTQIQFLCKTAHNSYTHLISSLLWGDKEQISGAWADYVCAVAYRDNNAREECVVMGQWDVTVFILAGLMVPLVLKGSVDVLNSHREVKPDNLWMQSRWITFPVKSLGNTVVAVQNQLEDLACCCILAATPAGCLAVMVTMPSDVTFPNFSSCGSHGRSAPPRPEPLWKQNCNLHPLTLCACACVCVCVCLCVCERSDTHALHLSCYHLFMQRLISTATFFRFVNNAAASVPICIALICYWRNRERKQTADTFSEKQPPPRRAVYVGRVSDRAEFSCFRRNTVRGVGAVCESASTEWFGFCWTTDKWTQLGGAGLLKIASI